MSITKLSPNWACQMGPIHCPKFLLPGLEPPFFSRPSTKNPDKIPLHKFPLNCSRGFCPGGFVRGVFGLEDFVRGGFYPFLDPSVTIHLLQQKVKHHFKFHV